MIDLQAHPSAILNEFSKKKRLIKPWVKREDIFFNQDFDKHIYIYMYIKITRMLDHANQNQLEDSVWLDQRPQEGQE